MTTPFSKNSYMNYYQLVQFIENIHLFCKVNHHPSSIIIIHKINHYLNSIQFSMIMHSIQIILMDDLYKNLSIMIPPEWKGEFDLFFMNYYENTIVKQKMISKEKRKSKKCFGMHFCSIF